MSNYPHVVFRIILVTWSGAHGGWDLLSDMGSGLISAYWSTAVGLGTCRWLQVISEW